MSYKIGASSGNLVWLATQTPSGAASIQFTSVITTAYDNYVLIWSGVITSAATPNILLQYSTDNGSSYISAANYAINRQSVNSAGSTFTQNATQTSLSLCRTQDTASNQTAGKATFYNISSGSHRPVAFSTFMGSGSVTRGGTYTGYYSSAIAVNAFQLFPASGTFTGTFKLYGVQK